VLKSAIIKIHTIRDRIKRLADYAINPDKTEQGEMTSVLNLDSVATASNEMDATKDYWDKIYGVQGYHIIQSFKPGEVSKEQCHEIGRTLAKRIFGDEYEVIVSTHLDKSHCHNHIVANSVNRLNGKKFRCQIGTYYNIRDVSDAICLENGLSVIDSTKESSSKHYAEWKAEKDGNLTIRQQIRNDIDELIPQAHNFRYLLRWLEDTKSYEIDIKGKYPKVKPPFAQVWIRIGPKLGKYYTQDELERRIEQSMDRQERRTAPTYRPMSHYYKVLTRKRPKLTYYQRLYWHYVYLIRRIKKRQTPPKLTKYMQAEIWKLHRYQKQYLFMREHNIVGWEDLAQIQTDILAKMENLQSERTELYKSRRVEPSEEKDERVAEIGQELKTLRQQAKLCEYIKEDAPTIEKRLARITDERQHLQTERTKAKSVGVQYR